MRRVIVSSTIFFALVAAVAITLQTQAQTTETRDPKMAPVDQYLMADRNAEIALARSAAPESISG